jgi:ribosome-associated protein
VTNLQTQRNARDISLRREEPSDLGKRDEEPGRTIADIALSAALDRKALEPTLLDVRQLCSYADFILVVSARSDRQVGAIYDSITTTLKQAGHMPLGTEGAQSGQWALVDFGEVIVHVFHHPIREHYDLESLWVDAGRVAIDVPDEARIRADQPIY